jgi:hypothetical protein
MGNQICSWIVGIFSLEFLVSPSNPVKYVPDPDVISKFCEKHGSRYNVRNNVDQVLLGYLSDVELLLPRSAKSTLSRKIKKVLGYFFLHFYIYIVISNDYIKLI